MPFDVFTISLLFLKSFLLAERSYAQRGQAIDARLRWKRVQLRDKGKFKSYAFGVAVVAFLGAVCLAVIVSAGLAEGLVLNRLFPAIDLGVATLCGLVAVAIFASVVKAMMLASVTRNIAADNESEAVLMRVVAKDAWIRTKSRSRR